MLIFLEFLNSIIFSELKNFSLYAIPKKNIYYLQMPWHKSRIFVQKKSYNNRTYYLFFLVKTLILFNSYILTKM